MNSLLLLSSQCRTTCPIWLPTETRAGKNDPPPKADMRATITSEKEDQITSPTLPEDPSPWGSVRRTIPLRFAVSLWYIRLASLNVGPRTSTNYCLSIHGLRREPTRNRTSGINCIFRVGACDVILVGVLVMHLSSATWKNTPARYLHHELVISRVC